MKKIMRNISYIICASLLSLAMTGTVMAADWSGTQSGNISGTLDMTGNVKVTGVLTLTGNTTINANGANRSIKRSGKWAGYIFKLNGHNLTINGGDYRITIDGGATYETSGDARTTVTYNPNPDPTATNSRLLYMNEGGNLKATNVDFCNQINMGDSHGSGILCDDGGTLTLTGCNFYGLKVDGICSSDDEATRGAAIYLCSTYTGNATIKSCKIYKNYTAGAGCLRTVGSTSSVVTVDGCEFYENLTKSLAPAIHWNAYGSETTKLIIKGDSKFHNNSGVSGGAISLSGNVDIQSAEFYQNYASNNGGAICLRTYNTEAQDKNIKDGCHLVISSSVSIHDNECKNNGGAIYQIIHVLPNTSYGCTGTTNPADFYVEISGGSIKNNYAGKDGGAIYIDDQTGWRTKKASESKYTYVTRHFTMSSGTIEGNSCGGNGGAVVINKVKPSGEEWDSSKTAEFPVTFTGGSIKNNKAPNGYGGAFYIDNQTYNYTGGNAPTKISGTVSIDGCEAKYGGAFCVKNSDFSVLSGNIKNNTATVNGGAFFVSSATSRDYVVGNDSGEDICEISGNSAASGGVFQVEGSEGTITVNKTTITGNSATGGNAGVFNLAGSQSAVIKSCTINNNSATGNGGVFYLSSGNMTISGGEISENSAADGGAIYVASGDIAITDGQVRNNTANGNGGAIYSTAGNVTINGGVISGNKARVSGSTGGYGGAFYISNTDESKAVTISQGTVNGNTAEKCGGAFCITNGTLTTTYGAINENVAAENGGGFYASGGTIYFNRDGVHYGSIISNSARNGAGVYLTDGANMQIQEALITQNHAIADNTISTAYHSDGTLSGNAIQGMGGGVYVANGASESKKTTLQFRKDAETVTLGIYGNIADNGGDEIVSDGNNTAIYIPSVTDMELSVFGGTSQGWFEDFVEGDTAYLDDGKTDVIRADNGVPVRYRKQILEGKKTFSYSANLSTAETKYACLTLGASTGTLTINKDGLNDGESSIFKISRSGYPDRTAILTGTGTGTTVSTTLHNIDVGNWTVSETGWSWGYTPDQVSKEITIYGGTKVNDNKVTFTNTEKTDNPKHAEAQKENNFSNDGAMSIGMGQNTL